MRVASFHVSGSHDKTAEVTIIPFAGGAGSELENVNRWRGEIGLTPITADALQGQSVPVGSGEGKLFEMTTSGAGGTNVATVAVMMAAPDTTWFFKLKGDAETVASARPAFLQFLKSITFAAPPSVAQSPVNTNAKEAKDSVADPEWHVPDGWIEQKAPPMVLRSFGVKGEKGEGVVEATVSIRSFPGTVGGPLANVNRWRAQLNLEPVEETALAQLTTSIDVLGGKAMLVDMTGTAKNSSASRMIAAMVPREGRTWFYKMMGDPAVVGAQKEAFTKFVQSVRYPNG